jgi:CBS domain-containing protein
LFAKNNFYIVQTDTILVAAICTSSIETVSKIVVCYPDTSLQAAEELMQSQGLPQLPVVTRVGRQWQDRGHQMVGVLHYEIIPQCIK